MLVYPVSSIAEEKVYRGGRRLPRTSRRTSRSRLSPSARYIGGISFNVIDWRNRQRRIGIVIGDKSFWGKGYGTDAMRVMMRLAFDKMNLHRMWSARSRLQFAAIASYEKCGFKREGVLREDHFSARQISRHDRDGDSRERVSRPALAAPYWPVPERFTVRGPLELLLSIVRTPGRRSVRGRSEDDGVGAFLLRFQRAAANLDSCKVAGHLRTDQRYRHFALVGRGDFFRLAPLAQLRGETSPSLARPPAAPPRSASESA